MQLDAQLDGDRLLSPPNGPPAQYVADRPRRKATRILKPGYRPKLHTKLRTDHLRMQGGS